MKIIEYKTDETKKQVLIRVSMTDHEFDNFDVYRYRKFDDFESSIAHTADAEQVIKAVMKATDYPSCMLEYVMDTKKSGRGAKLIETRRLMMYNLRKYTPLTLTKIGLMFNSDHSTVIHHIKRFNDLLGISDERAIRFDNEVDSIMDRLLTE